ncbi:MAG: HEAT repeat domain-containing protein [Planctomycetota bacterium]|nr:HEAT repeat domain-containing protein [Planctomycetota bacterium]
MNRWVKLVVAAVVGAGWLLGGGAVVKAEDEAVLIAVLQSDKGPAEKDQACQKLKLSGTAKAVPALAGLLTDERLSHSARNALEVIPGEPASAALLEAVGKTKGPIKAGVIDSLGARRDRQAVGALTVLVSDADAAVAASAAAALGRIGGAEAVVALIAAKAKGSAEQRAVVADALLMCADGLFQGGERGGASDVYRAVYGLDAPEQVRTAAYRGMVLAAGGEVIGLVEKGLTGSDQSGLLASLQLVREIRGEAATKAFGAVIAKVSPVVQIAIMEGLAQRGDLAAAGAVVAAAQNGDPAVRVAAIKALGAIGGAAEAMMLAETAGKTKDAEQEAARQALTLLRDPKVCEVLLAGMQKASPGVQAEIVVALGQRQETGAVPALLKMAEATDDAGRVLALRALAILANTGHAGELTRVLVAAKTDEERAAAEAALAASCARGGRAEACVPQVLAAMKGQGGATRAALLRVAGRLGGAESLTALRAAVADSEAVIQEAALRTMAEYAGVEAGGDLIKLAGDQQRSMAQRVLALRGYWRVVGAASDRTVEERWRLCAAGMAAAQRPEEKRLGLAELAKVPHLEALKLATKLCEEEGVGNEAEAACVRIAAALAGSNPSEAKAALRRVAQNGKSEGTRAEARKALESVDQYVGYITVWSAAGPYRQGGKQCAELFDVAFAPEIGGADVKWKALSPPADPGLFWQADLLPLADGEQCVVYVKSRVWSPHEQKVRLDIGSDDGYKIWVNGKLVHANNTMRPLQAGQDRGEATLKDGWNDVMVKVTQNNMGFGVSVRIRNTDGSVMEGLRFEAGGR